MRTSRGFTLVEVVLVLFIAAVLGAIVIRQGLSARQSADLAGGVFELGLRLGSMKARAVSDAKDYLIVVIAPANDAACARQREQCGEVVVLRNPTPAFTLNGFSATPPIANAEWVEVERLPLNTRFDTTTPWTLPAPFNAVTPFDPAIQASCAGGRSCFAIRFRSTGDVTAVFPGGVELNRAGYAFVLGPVETQNRAAERRGLFVSFPAGIVKTAAF